MDSLNDLWSRNTAWLDQHHDSVIAALIIYLALFSIAALVVAAARRRSVRAMSAELAELKRTVAGIQVAEGRRLILETKRTPFNE